MLKRGDPGREEYVEITPQDSLNVSLDLAEAYDVKRPGRYLVKVTGSLFDVTKDAAAVPRPRDRQVPMALAVRAADARRREGGGLKRLRRFRCTRTPRR